jgi:hypothetical protein
MSNVFDNDKVTGELAELNIDWSATAAIYVGETDIRSLSSKKRGFYGTVRLTLNVSSIAFCRKVTKHDDYRFFNLKTPPLLRITLEYIYNETDDDDVLPLNLNLEWEYYPEEWPVKEKETHVSWLTEKCEARLKQENELISMCSSFSIVELCEHESLSYWETIHQHNEFRLIILPPEMDHMYHHNVGTILHPRKEAFKAMGSIHSCATPTCIQEFSRQALIKSWETLYCSYCPICFDIKRCDKGITLPCGDFFCKDCFDMYLRVKVTELSSYRTNPFLCPVEKCRAELPIPTLIKRHLSEGNYNLVERWQKDLEFPQCFALDRCLSKTCITNSSVPSPSNAFYMRKCSSSIKNFFVFCEVCEKSWCELCLKRIKPGVTHQQHREVCESQMALKFCRRYLRATGGQQIACQDKFPWIQTYSRHSQQHDGAAMQWILENGQCCPNCSTGVERIEGCFHMKCPTCATHFCYEVSIFIFILELLSTQDGIF